MQSLRPMWFSALFLLSLLFPDLSSSCCCTVYLSCRCNIFACNCDTDEGYCYKNFKGSVPGWKYDCRSTRGTKREEFCPDRRRKRSAVSPILQAYAGGPYYHLLERHAMENFFTFDLNRDGLISLEEAMESSNGTIEGFKQVDVNNDGFVRPSEFDNSLV